MKAFTSRKQQGSPAPDNLGNSLQKEEEEKAPDGAGEKRPEDGSLGVFDHQQGRGALTLVLIQSGCNVTIVLYRVFLQQRCLFKI